MNHEFGLIITLTGALTAALIMGSLAQKLRLSPIVGYLLAGVLVGPFTPGFVADSGLANQFAELGVILLMFGVGLQFHVKELLAVRRLALPGALLGMVVATLLGALLGRSSGWSNPAALLFGVTIAISSTVVLLRVLADNDALHTPAGHICVGWLVVEDILTVLVLVLLPIFGRTLSRSVGGAREVAVAISLAMAKIGGLVVFTLVVGRRLLPRVLGWVARTRSRDLFTLTVLVLALGIALGSARLFGASMALGAFLAGMVVGQSEFSSRAASEALPMRDAFAVLFFVSIGMLFDPSSFRENLPLTAGTVAAVLLGKPIAAFTIARVLRYPTKTAVATAISLCQIGEFSFVVAAAGIGLGILPARATQVLVVAAIFTIAINPILFRSVDAIVVRLGAGKAVSSREESGVGTDAHRCIVVGYGPVGRTVTRLLKEQGFITTVIELNHDTVSTLQREGTRAVYGDATQREILEQAGVRKATSLIFAASGTPPEAVIRMARELNATLRVLSRSATLREAAKAREAGAHTVIAAEAEVALAMTEHLLSGLGATSEQLDRARDRVRRELF